MEQLVDEPTSLVGNDKVMSVKDKMIEEIKGVVKGTITILLRGAQLKLILTGGL
jgi:hypothetical protein